MGYYFPSRIDEGIMPTIIASDTSPCFLKISKSICKIKVKNKYYSGFLIKIEKDQDNEVYFFCLMTIGYIITKNMLKDNETINVKYDNNFVSINIRLNERDRYIKNFNDNNLDISVIEIIPEDDIYEDFFLTPELSKEYINEKKLKYSQIYTPKRDKGKGLLNTKGIIEKIDDYEFTRSFKIEEGSFGTPIFLKDNIKVIGINKGEFNGNLIYPVIELIKRDIRKTPKRLFKKIIKKEYITGDYYIGDLIDDIPNGKGKLFYKTKKIKYEGEFKDERFNGKGKEYYPEGDIKYEGDFIDDKYEGKGKYFWTNGEYYVGEFKKGTFHGKGKEIYKDGNIKYDGNFVDGLYEGIGKYNYKSGNYYKGQWKEGKKNGNGEKCDKEGNILEKGEYNNGVFLGDNISS